MSITLLCSSCNFFNNGGNQPPDGQNPEPAKFTLIGDLVYNQKDDGSRQSAYIYREYYFQGQTIRLNYIPIYEDGLLKRVSSNPAIERNHINYDLFSRFLGLNFVRCDQSWNYGTFPIATQQKIHEIIRLYWQLI